MIQMFSFQTGDVQVSCEFFWGVVCFGTPIDTPRITLRNCLVEDGIKKTQQFEVGKMIKDDRYCISVRNPYFFLNIDFPVSLRLNLTHRFATVLLLSVYAVFFL